MADHDALVEPVGGSPVRDAVLFVRGLGDARLRVGLTRGMLATIYRLGVLFALIPPAYLTVLAFQNQSVLWGVAWALVMGPALFVVLVTALRLVLGFALVFLSLMEQLMLLPAAVVQLSQEVESLRSDVGALPTAMGDLTGHLQGLQPVVGALTAHVDSLQDSLDSVQFWRAPGLRRRMRRAERGELPPEDE